MRHPSIDLLRTFAIVVMVLVHFGENLAGYVSPLTGFGAPLFAFLSGVSYRLWVVGQLARGTSSTEISKISVRRGLFVFGVGFAFNMLVWLPSDTFNWDVLTFVGSALILLNLLRSAPQGVSLLIAVLAIVGSPLLRRLADYDSYWQNGYFDPDMTLTDVLVGYLATGYFPIFPWIAFSLAGAVTAARLFRVPAETTDPAPSVRPTILTGTLLLAVAGSASALQRFAPGGVAASWLSGWKMFPPTTEYVLGALGFALVLLGVVHLAVDRNPRARRFERSLNLARAFSRNSLTIYIVHHLVHIWPLWIYATWVGEEPTAYWMKALSIPTALALAGLFLLACVAVFRIVGCDRSYGIEAWMRWLCD